MFDYARVWLIGTGAILLAASSSFAQPAAPAAACDSASHRQFDFWIGDWTVTNPTGSLVGHNTITPISNGCALLEQWRGADGSSGTSINFFEAGADVWHQLWVGGRGMILRLKGKFRDGRIELTSPGKRNTANGAVLDRIIWTPAADGSVEQLWLVSSDDGATWAELFRGVYRRTTQ
jgi:hypothetical protein